MLYKDTDPDDVRVTSQVSKKKALCMFNMDWRHRDTVAELRKEVIDLRTYMAVTRSTSTTNVNMRCQAGLELSFAFAVLTYLG